MSIHKSVERVVRPIVEGQIRGFIKEHPSILTGVDWYKPRKDKATTLTNSLAKRIVRDLACETTIARLVAAIVDDWSAEQPASTVASANAAKWPGLAHTLARAVRKFFHVEHRETNAG